MRPGFDKIWQEEGLDGLKLPHSCDAMLWARALEAGLREDPARGEADSLVGWFANAMWAQECRLSRDRKNESELRGVFERILCAACCDGTPAVGHIRLADRLINAFRSWEAGE
jgi:hypothetical protein